ncbi:MAG: hypothetical protein KGL18_20920 [Burkholderiales bacterium]|nr:hypothetical protein [Burkholderiales bacterium]MDE1926951.1 hypothetical protein [Burkholderiales bacterium]MDE2505432.1 hypothetical protein [Burkholderiales bacterium]
MRRSLRAAAIVVFALLAGAARAAGAAARLIDDFSDPSRWTLSTTDDVHARLARADDGAGLCVAFDFGRVTGEVTLRREVAIDYPSHYAFALTLRGAAPPNAFRFKLLDASGDNVWWVNRPDFDYDGPSRTLRLRQRDIAYAWGPAADHRLRRSAALELVIGSGRGAGHGRVCFERLVLRELPPPDTRPPPPPRPVPGPGLLTLDYGREREFSAIEIDSGARHPAADYTIEASDDGKLWRTLRVVEGARGARQDHWLGASTARYLRLEAAPGAAAAAPPSGIELHSPADVNAFFAGLAARAPRGAYPRAYGGAQSYWTVFGVDGGAVAALLGEDGRVEPLPGIGALEPMLVEGGRVRGWADLRYTHSLLDGDLPMPRVHGRTADGIALDIQAFGSGGPAAAQALVRYRVGNRTRRWRDITLALAWRPFQVNPPTQFLAHPGGVVELRAMDWDGRTLRIDGQPRLRALRAPDAVRMAPQAAGPVPDWLTDPATTTNRLRDAAGHASAALLYRLRLAPGATREVDVALPQWGRTQPPASLRAEQRRVAAHWRSRLDRVRITGPTPALALARTLRASLGQILVNRSGAAIQPGARAYARSWIRDGALTSTALLRLGQADVVRDFLRWYAPFQFTSGKIPCCATPRGADPVPENDSDGEFAYAADALWNYSHDLATARLLWPHVRAAVNHLERLRASERGDANRQGERRAYFGLLPPSISHEGYADKPAYSYWDDFWASIGYRGAAALARALGHDAAARRIAGARAEFDADLGASLRLAAAMHGLDLLPGSADRGDVDPTSSTVALSPGGWLDRGDADFDARARRTFERYWHDFDTRRRGADWNAYTPYEWRTVASLVRLGERARALAVVDFLNRDRRPAGWEQWAEVVFRDARAPHFIGDMPHGWVASDHIRSVLDLYAYEREESRGLVLAAGLPLAWFEGPAGIGIEGLRTPYGRLGWHASAHRTGSRVRVEFHLQGLERAVPGGVVLRGPWPAGARCWIDGVACARSAARIPLPRTGATVRIEFAAALPAAAPPNAGIGPCKATADVPCPGPPGRAP